MPRWVCERCSHEFWGWAVYYAYSVSGVLICPDCDGELVEKDIEEIVVN